MLPKPNAARPICSHVFLRKGEGPAFRVSAQGQLRLITNGHQQGRQLAEFDLLRREGDGGLAPGEIHLRFADARMQLEQIFQQPDTGHAMDRRQMQGDSRLPAIGEIEQFLLHRRIVQKCPFGAGRRRADAGAGRRLQLIKFFQSILAQQAEHGLATHTAKGLARQGKRLVRTRLPAMETPFQDAPGARGGILQF